MEAKILKGNNAQLCQYREHYSLEFVVIVNQKLSRLHECQHVLLNLFIVLTRGEVLLNHVDLANELIGICG